MQNHNSHKDSSAFRSHNRRRSRPFRGVTPRPINHLIAEKNKVMFGNRQAVIHPTLQEVKQANALSARVRGSEIVILSPQRASKLETETRARRSPRSLQIEGRRTRTSGARPVRSQQRSPRRAHGAVWREGRCNRPSIARAKLR